MLLFIRIVLFLSSSERLILANHSLKQLNIIDDNAEQGHGQQSKYSSVLKMLNLCMTPMGKRKFTYDLLNPTTQIDYLEKEYAMTEHLLDISSSFHSLSLNLKEIKDISKWTRQIIMKKITPKNIYQMYYNLSFIQEMITILKNDDYIVSYLNTFLKINNIHNINHDCSLIHDFLNTHFILDLCKDLEDVRDFETLFIQSNIKDLGFWHKGFCSVHLLSFTNHAQLVSLF